VTKKNYIINGAMMISQENGATAGSVSGYYPVDQFRMFYANAGTQTAQNLATTRTPGGSYNRLRVTATVADAAVAAGDYCAVYQPIEGYRVADLGLGYTVAKTVTLQFGVKAPAGTYCVCFYNIAGNRTYIAEYVIAAGEANTDVVKSITLALDTTGIWEVTTVTGLIVQWTLMCGATFTTGVVNAWTGTGSPFGTANQFNFMGTAGNIFELFDVSLTEGSVAPPFQVPDYASELALCQRYFYKRSFPASTWVAQLQAFSTTQASGAVFDFPVTMRGTPTLLQGAPFQLLSAVGSAIPLSGGAYTLTPDYIMANPLIVSSGLVAGNATMLNTASANYMTFCARL